MSNFKKALLIVFAVLVLDQILKIWVKTHMYIGESIPILGNWFQISFTENNGMAFGVEFGGEFGKIFLSLFRIIAIGIIGWYIWDICKKEAHPGFIFSMALIFAGAIGNIIDSAVYGLIFTQSGYSPVDVAKFSSHGYSTFLHGKVVDMLYFPIIKGTIPSWFPFWKSQPFTFFSPIFNLADSAITIGVFIILIFQKKFFKKTDSMEPVNTAENTVAPLSAE